MFPKSASSILVVFCMVAVVFTGCLDDAEEVEETLPEEVKCLLITGEYQIVDLETTASAGMSSGDEITVSYTHLTLPTIYLCRSRWSPYH